jgi:hypothetical protein
MGAAVRALQALALGSVLALPAPPMVRALCIATMLLVMFRSRRRERPPVRRLELAPDGRCVIVDARGASTEATLAAGSLALPGAVVLALEQREGGRALWLSSDAFSRDELRQLRVRLRVAA